MNSRSRNALLTTKKELKLIISQLIKKKIILWDKTTDNIENLKKIATNLNLDPIQIVKETDNSMLMEGLYIKVEENGIVVDRMKYVRNSFKQDIVVSSQDWLVRPIIQNQLSIDINDLFVNKKAL